MEDFLGSLRPAEGLPFLGELVHIGQDGLNQFLLGSEYSAAEHFGLEEVEEYLRQVEP
ncbi:MAG: hypothetical protein Q8O40_10065 [Chloroflexota bacterium]|nr:hypothetical protein [Chloroflexota bacterium]